ncbi:5619_t:CDS:2, partial [Gigaspora rosea]
VPKNCHQIMLLVPQQLSHQNYWLSFVIIYLKKDFDKSYFEDVVKNKEIFLNFFLKLFAKCLINKTSQSEYTENSLISKLKETCGIEYTSKLQRMLNDMELSKDLNDQ